MKQQNKCYPPPQGVYLPISKLHSILAVSNLLAHNNKFKIFNRGQISLQSAADNCSFSDNLTPLGVAIVLLAMVPTGPLPHATLVSPPSLAATFAHIRIHGR